MLLTSQYFSIQFITYVPQFFLQLVCLRALANGKFGNFLDFHDHLMDSGEEQLLPCWMSH